VLAPVDVAEEFRRGINLCRDEKWHEAYGVLIKVAQGVERRGNLPGLFYSYLGLAMAHCDGRRHEPVELCRYALRVQPEQPENYLNLASIYVILGRRESAVRLVGHGLQMRPGHLRLLELEQQLGRRQTLAFPTLSRRHPLNSIPGRVRSWWRRRRDRAAERRREIELFGT
jgi:hypothetical protein